MAYLNDPRENRIGPEGETWEQDNRKEERYLWNGAYLDLCNLPPIEYMKTIFVTRPEGGSGGGESGKTENVINITSTEIKDNIGNVTGYEYSATASDPVSSKVTITVSFKDDKAYEPIQLRIVPGQCESERVSVDLVENTPAPVPEKVESEPKSDNIQIYVPNLPRYIYSSGVIFKDYTEVNDIVSAGNISDKVEVNVDEDGTGYAASIKTMIKAVDRSQFEGMSPIEFMNKNYTRLFLLVNENMAIEEIIEDVSDLNISGKENWKPLHSDTGNASIRIDGISYDIYERQSGDITTQFIEKGKEDKNFIMKISLSDKK